MRRLANAFSLGLLLGCVLFTPAAAAEDDPFCIIRNARDFDGALVTEPPGDSLEWFSWFRKKPEGGQQETSVYEDTYAVYSYVIEDIHPVVWTAAEVPDGLYRIWIFQSDESHDRSLEVSIGADPPVRTGFDSGELGTHWTWLDVGIHALAPDTLISVRAVGDYTWHGAPWKQRRGGFSSLYFTTDLSPQAPPFVPDGQSEDLNGCGYPDSDGDGIVDMDDDCPATAGGDIVDAAGCSIADTCPCDYGWRNHGEYVSCVVYVSSVFAADGLITEAQREQEVSSAGRSGCGKRSRK